MGKGRTLRFLVVFLCGFLATTTSVYAAHFVAAGLNYQITDDTSDTSVQCWLLRVASPPPEFKPVIPTQFECIVVHKDTSTLFRLSASLKEIESIKVDPIKQGNVKVGSEFFVTGKVLSHIVFVSRRGVRFLTEGARFEMTGRDMDIPPAKDSFDLAFNYRQRGIGALLLEAVPDLMRCDDAEDTCTLQLAEKKTVEEGEGEIEAHTAGGE
jgi:hypothetical protein